MSAPKRFEDSMAWWSLSVYLKYCYHNGNWQDKNMKVNLYNAREFQWPIKLKMHVIQSSDILQKFRSGTSKAAIT